MLVWLPYLQGPVCHYCISINLEILALSDTICPHLPGSDQISQDCLTVSITWLNLATLIYAASAIQASHTVITRFYIHSTSAPASLHAIHAQNLHKLVRSEHLQFAFVVFAFLVGFGIEAAVGSAWLASNPEPNGVTEKAGFVLRQYQLFYSSEVFLGRKGHKRATVLENMYEHVWSCKCYGTSLAIAAVSLSGDHSGVLHPLGNAFPCSFPKSRVLCFMYFYDML